MHCVFSQMLEGGLQPVSFWQVTWLESQRPVLALQEVPRPQRIGELACPQPGTHCMA